jgi:hypothetical protein
VCWWQVVKGGGKTEAYRAAAPVWAPMDSRWCGYRRRSASSRSEAVEKIIREVRENIGNKELGWLFENCFPNTLDTTVNFELIGGKPDTYVITGDIDAMWLRDSSAQVWPYLPFVSRIRICSN